MTQLFKYFPLQYIRFLNFYLNQLFYSLTLSSLFDWTLVRVQCKGEIPTGQSVQVPQGPIHSKGPVSHCVSTGANLFEKLFMNMYLKGTISKDDKDQGLF